MEKGRQIVDPRFPKEDTAASCDRMSTNHRDLCYSPAMNGRPLAVFEIVKVPGYHIYCGPDLKTEITGSIISSAHIGRLVALRKIPYQQRAYSASSVDDESADEPMADSLPTSTQAADQVNKTISQLALSTTASLKPATLLFPEHNSSFLRKEIASLMKEWPASQMVDEASRV